MMNKQVYDLEDRLLGYSVRIIKIVEQLPGTYAGKHVANQILRSGTSPYPNHGDVLWAGAAPFQSDVFRSSDRHNFLVLNHDPLPGCSSG